ncbi:MAG: hypothetical protein RSC41_03180, partial [Oscillospiraceae bacterium]
MKRPLFVFGITYLISTVVCVYFLKDLSFIFGGICFLVGTIVYIFFKSKKIGGIFLAATVSLFMFYVYNEVNLAGLEKFYESDIVIQGRL